MYTLLETNEQYISLLIAYKGWKMSPLTPIKTWRCNRDWITLMNDMSVYSSGLDLLRYWLNYLEIFQLQETNISLVSCQNYVCRSFLEWSGKCISWGAEPCGVAETWHTAHIWTPQTSRFLKNSPREFFLFLFLTREMTSCELHRPQYTYYML